MANVSKEVLDRQSANVLARAIQKALDNGWRPLRSIEGANLEVVRWVGQHLEVVWTRDDYVEPLRWVRELEGIIYNHDFARALWGEFEAIPEIVQFASTTPNKLSNINKGWRFHLRDMVIAEDPLAYLRDNLPQ